MTFYEAQTNSPSTTLSSAIGVSDTTLAVENIEIFADLTLPNLLTLGFTQANSETVLATEISGNNITVTRGVDGTATDWDSGTPIARVFTAYDWNGLINDFGTKQDEIMVSGILKGNGSGVISTAVAGTDYVTPSNLPTPSSSTPNMDGTASAGSSTNYSRADHVHPTDTSRAAVSAIPAPSSTTPKMDGSASAGTSSNYSRADHVHPTDTSRAAVSAIPTPATTTPNMDGTASAGSSVNYSRADHIHPSDTTKQNEITVSGILKGDGTGDIVAANDGVDYFGPESIVPINNGGTGSSSADGARTNLGLGSAATANTTTTVANNNNLPTGSAIVNMINRTTAVDQADTNYTTYMARGESLNSSATSPTINGTIAWQYE